MGSTLRNRDPQKSKEYLQRAINVDPNHDIALIELGRILKSEGDLQGAKEKFQKVYDMFLKQWKTNSLPTYAYGWFASVAEELGESEFGREIRRSTPGPEGEAYYNVDNLSKTKTNMLTKI